MKISISGAVFLWIDTRHTEATIPSNDERLYLFIVAYLTFGRNYFWCKEGWELEDNPCSTAFEIFWMFFEPALFGVTGATIQINKLGERLDVLAIGVGILVTTGLVRILTTAFIAFGDNLNVKEKVRTIFLAR